MTDLEKKILELSKAEPGMTGYLDKMIREASEDVVDRAALAAVHELRKYLQTEGAKDKEPQALWRFIRYLTENEMPMQIIDYSAMLWPGNGQYFLRAVPPTVFKLIQQQASLMLENKKYENEEHKEWLENIANGQLPYGYSIQITKER